MELTSGICLAIERITTACAESSETPEKQDVIIAEIDDVEGGVLITRACFDDFTRCESILGTFALLDKFRKQVDPEPSVWVVNVVGGTPYLDRLGTGSLSLIAKP